MPRGSAVNTGQPVELAVPGLPGAVHAVALRYAPDESLWLDPAELRMAAGMGPVRRADFAAGRTCARHALARLGATGPVLAGPDGAPRWPAGTCGTISHKDGLAVALVGPADVVDALGVDAELAEPLPPPVWRTVLTPAELATMPAEGTDTELTLRTAFSAKEAYYKWFRSTGRSEPVGFHDITVRRQGGTLCFRAETPGRFPEPDGAVVRIQRWLMTVAWSPAAVQ